MSLVTLSIASPSSEGLPSQSRIANLVSHVFSGEDLEFGSVGIILAGHEAVLELNKTWLEHDYHTDVLSFLLESDPIEGEVYVDIETAAERHVEFGTTLTAEIERYIVHGVLHLCGHEDATDEERKQMKALEDQYLSEFALSKPSS